MIDLVHGWASAQPNVAPVRHSRPIPSRPKRAPRPSVRTWFPDRSLLETHGEIAPLQVWWSLEDLWLRLHRAGRLRSAEPDTLVLPGFRKRAIDDELGQFALEYERYDWRVGIERGSFLRSLHFDSDDLLCQLTPSSVMLRWPEGRTLMQLRTALLWRLRSRA